MMTAALPALPALRAGGDRDEREALAQRIDGELLPQTVEFAEAADKILKPIATASWIACTPC